ncbi:disulfide bond formation protein B [Ancylobacter sp. VKM B-3255]|uniref:Disulfide bond formation protein B n=2 Tax=Ancylobacter radicis TaxID=2836179 RepID=A0ABS5R696_9HYPH|nr:disulfide bond formation protein B [Ancylobacter radicis]
MDESELPPRAAHFGLSPALSRGLNALGVMSVSLVLILAFVDQISHGDFPCTLCIMQRVGFIGVATGLCLNLRFGPRPSHYAIALLSAMIGGFVSARQALLHLAPATRVYGEPALDMHFYTWALTLFCIIIAGCTFLLLFDRQGPQVRRGRRRLSPFGFTALFVISILTLVNGLSTVMECGTGGCPEDPANYRLLEKIAPLAAWLSHAATEQPH